jgi:hypothetical protein
MTLPPDLTSFFSFIATPIFGAWLISHVFENLPFWANLTATAKQGATLAVYLVLGLVSFALVHWVPGTVVENLQPIYAIIVAVLASWVSGSAFHYVVHTRAKARAARYGLAG